jgi:hypothetical protein
MRFFGRGPSRAVPTLGGGRRPSRKRPFWRVVRVVVLAAAALMIVTASISYSNNKLRRRKTYMTVAELTDAVLRFHHDFQRYPDGFDQLLRPPADQPAYLERIPHDAWGNPFRYQLVLEPAPGTFHILSNGPDGEAETGDDIENL